MIHLKEKGATVILELSKPPANAFGMYFLKEIYHSLEKIEKKKHVEFVIITSSFWSSFSSGLDLRELSGTLARRKINVVKAVRLVHKILHLIICSRKIFIAALRGAVVGSAVSLALACDFRFAGPSSWFWMPDPVYGGVLADGGLDLVAKYLSFSNVKRICLTSERIGAQRALEMQMIDGVMDEKLMERGILDFIDNLSSYSQISLQETKAILNKGLLNPIPLRSLWKAVNSCEMEIRLGRALNRKTGVEPKSSSGRTDIE